MQVVMLDSVSMANGVLKAGSIYDITDARAQKLIDKGLAKPLPSNVVDEPIRGEKAMVKARRITTSLPHGEKG
jgi:hypothetical protein